MAYLAAELLDRGALKRRSIANLILGSVNTAPAAGGHSRTSSTHCRREPSGPPEAWAPFSFP